MAESPWDYQCCGSGMFITDPNFFHPGYATKNLGCFIPKKIFLSSRKYDLGCSSRDPDPDILPIPDPRSRGEKGTGSWIPDPQYGGLHMILNLGSPFMSTYFLKEHDFFSLCGSEKFFFCRNKKKEKDRSRSRSRRRSRSRSRSRSGSRDKKKKKRKDRSRSRSGGGDNKRKERDEAEKEAGEVHSDGERKKVRLRPSLP
jgi:hypothetical protein